MTDKPKDPSADSVEDAIDAVVEDVAEDSAQTEDAATADANRLTPNSEPVEAEWDDPSSATDTASTEEAAITDEDAARPKPDDDGDAAEAVAVTTAAAAIAAGSGATAERETPSEPLSEPKAGSRHVLAYAWLFLLTLVVLYVLYLLMADAPGLRARLSLADAPEIAAARTAGADAAKQAQANAAALAALAAKPADAGVAPAEVAAIAGRTDTLAGDLAALETAMARMRMELEAAIAAKPAAAPTGGETAADAAARAQTNAALAEVKTALAALKTDVGGRVDGLNAALAAATERIKALEARAEKGSGRTLAAAMLALHDLRVGVSSGKPFGKLLGRAQAASPDAAALRDAGWTGFADQGLPTEDTLLADMQTLSVAIGQDQLKDRLSSGESWLDRAVGGVVDRLKVRRVGANVAGDEPAAVAARAEAALLNGDINAAIAEVETLDGEGAARFQDWLAGAKAVVAAKTDIDAVEKAAIAAADGA